jgi:uncharacterized protein (TIGR00255 family)
MELMSMTGFGRAGGRLSDRFAVSLVVRTVNHKYLDIQVRTNLREEAPELETAVRAVIEEHIRRGRVAVQVVMEHGSAVGSEVQLDTAQAEHVLEQLAAIHVPSGVSAALGLGDLLAVPGLVSVRPPETILDPDETVALRAVVGSAVDGVLRMRRDEGARIAAQVRDELAEVEGFVDWLEPQLPVLRRAIMDRTRERVQAMIESIVDEERLAQEAALLADRADVAEEVVRLRAHFAAFSERLRDGGVVGRTLDFLCQEIHRELNTLGSKCREAGVADRLVDAKSSAERVREQIQNLE